MSDDANQKDDGSSGGRKKGSFLWPIIVIIVGCASAAAGFVLPSLLGPATSEPAHKEAKEEVDGLAFIPFGDAVVNLDEGRLNRYLRVSLTLQVKKSEEVEVKKIFEARQDMLRSWLLAYLADKDMEAIRGAAGQNRVRRDVLDHFNEALFESDTHRIQDVLFKEFNVQ